jgi:hypothetical protein
MRNEIEDAMVFDEFVLTQPLPSNIEDGVERTLSSCEVAHEPLDLAATETDQAGLFGRLRQRLSTAFSDEIASRHHHSSCCG